MFVLDSSGSVGHADFQTAKEYIYNFTESLLNGDTESRVGVIQYGSSASVEIELDSREREMVLEAINDLTYIRGGTNTPEALCLLKDSPWRTDVSILRIAVVLTDGMSNEQSVTCMQESGQLGTLTSATEEIHSLDPPVTVFAVGVSNYVVEELHQIASDPQLVNELASFDYRLLVHNQQSLSYFICFIGKLI